MTIPDLGFGTASIMGRVSRRAGVAALGEAYAAGVRHFDTARSYGWGDAESVLGTFLSAHPRDEFRIVTKCGILPARRSGLLSVAKGAARAVLKVSPRLTNAARKVASTPAFSPSRSSDVDVLKQSFATSLTELGTSHVDVLLLHNFAPGMSGLEEVVAWFRELRKEGKIRRFGFSVEGDLIDGLNFLGKGDFLADAVIQAPVCEQLLTLPAEWRRVPFFAHAPFAYLRSRAESGAASKGLGDLLAGLADACRCEAVVCSMFSSGHIAGNVAAWKDSVARRGA